MTKLQRCYICDALTGRCEEDSIYLPPNDPCGNDIGPLCEACCDEIDPHIDGVVPIPGTQEEQTFLRKRDEDAKL